MGFLVAQAFVIAIIVTICGLVWILDLVEGQWGWKGFHIFLILLAWGIFTAVVMAVWSLT